MGTRVKEKWRRYERVHEGDVESELRDELAFHVEMRAEALRAAGMPDDAARREAERSLGDMQSVVTQCRDEAERTWRRRRAREEIMGLMRDGLHAVRGLRRRPLFFGAACATLALGIGATTAVYSMVDAVLLAPLPYGDPDRLVVIRTIDGEGEERPLAREARERLREAGSAYAGIAAWGGGSRIMSGAGEPEEIDIIQAEHNLFNLLGARPAHGALFNADHRAEGGDPRVVLLSWTLFQQRFGGDPGVIGRTIDLNERPHVIRGVMPPGFEFPVGSGAQAWTPLVHAPIDDDLRFVPVENAVARLAPDVGIERAGIETSEVVARVAVEGTDPWGAPVMLDDRPWSARVVPVHEAMLVSDRALMLLLGAVGVLLAIACANVANLFLVRASERRGELAVRAALGGSRRDLARPAIVEVGIVCICAAAVGLILAHWAVLALASLDPGGLPRWHGIDLNARAWLVGSLATGLAAVLCSLAPALTAAGTSPGSAIDGGARSTSSPGRVRLRDAIVAAEIGLVFVLLVGAGLLLRSFAAVRNVDAGYEVDSVVTARVILPPSRYPRPGTAAVQFFTDALTQVRAHPAVVTAGAVSAVPMSDGGTRMGGELASPVTGRVATGGKLLFATPDYFTALGVALRGRDFAATDRMGAPRVAIFNESMARHMFPGEDALGRRFTAGPGEWEVIGVVPDIHYDGPEQTPAPTYYAPYAQFTWLPGMVFAVRTVGDASMFGRILVSIIREIDPAMPVADVRTLDQNLSRVLARRRFDLVMLTSIALTGLGLAAVGVFGVMAHAVAQRRQELGIRQALGANAGDIVALVLRHMLTITTLGVAGGALLAIVSVRALRTVLFGVEPVDPIAFALATCTVAVVGLLAALVPARRATRVDPVVTLRS